MNPSNRDMFIFMKTDDNNTNMSNILFYLSEHHL